MLPKRVRCGAIEGDGGAFRTQRSINTRDAPWNAHDAASPTQHCSILLFPWFDALGGIDRMFQESVIAMSARVLDYCSSDSGQFDDW